MFKKLKATIKDLAKAAVLYAEEALGSNKGQQKKKLAIEYVVKHLPSPFKTVISILLSSFIDDAIEFAVEYMEVL